MLVSFIASFQSLAINWGWGGGSTKSHFPSLKLRFEEPRVASDASLYKDGSRAGVHLVLSSFILEAVASAALGWSGNVTLTKSDFAAPPIVTTRGQQPASSLLSLLWYLSDSKLYLSKFKRLTDLWSLNLGVER